MWMPVIFFCMVDGSCNFWTTELFDSKKECEIVVLKTMSKLDDEPTVSASEGVCLPVKIKGI
jgi:hypothetical protein